jgi:hypothetical protein
MVTDKMSKGYKKNVGDWLAITILLVIGGGSLILSLYSFNSF